MKPDRLGVWLYGTRIATLSDGGSTRIAMTWHVDAVERWGLGSRVVSDFLPVADPSDPVHPRRAGVFFDGLLAEGNARVHMAFAAGTDPDDIYGMLCAYGRDTAGALVIAPHAEAQPERAGTPVPVTERAVADLLRKAISNQPAQGIEPPWQSKSLAGLRPKIALAHGNGGYWMQTDGGYPTTHILKPGAPAGSVAFDVIHTEAACADLANRMGIGCGPVRIETFGDIETLVIPRYDRTIDPDGTVQRIHQEDTAQALGINTREADRKFQHGRTIPSLRAVAAVIQRAGGLMDPLVDLIALNVVVGNTDAHAKNISVIHPADGYGRLAPAYDVSMHLHHPSADRTLAMNIGDKRSVDDVSGSDLVNEVTTWGLRSAHARRLVTSSLERVSGALSAIDRTAHPGVSDAAWNVADEKLASLTTST